MALPATALSISFELGRADCGLEVRARVRRDGGVYAVTLRGVSLDTTLIPALRPSPRDWCLVVLPTAGEVRFGGRAIGAGSAVALRERGLTAAAPVAEALFATPGTRAVALRVMGDEAARVPHVFPVSPRARAAFDRAEAALREGDAEAADEAGRDVAGELVADGVLRPRAPSAARDAAEPDIFSSRIAAALYPALSRLVRQPMLVDLVDLAGVGERQMLRTVQRVQSRFDLSERGWRATILRWRVTTAVLLLSNPGVPLEAVARESGYSSLTALGRALRAYGLPAPSDVRARLTHHRADVETDATRVR